MKFFRGQKMRLRVLREWLVSRDANFSYGIFLIILLAPANDHDGEGQCNGRQLFPVQGGHAETLEAEGKGQRHDQCSKQLKSRISVEKESCADKLKNGSQKQKKAAQT